VTSILAGSPVLEPPGGGPASRPHIVHFYESSDVLCDAVADFLAAGAAAGEPLIVIATEPHRLALTERLKDRGVERVEMTMLDAQATLDRIMVESEPDPARFAEVIETAIEALRRRWPGVPVRAYGEMVNVLWQQGNSHAALRLEELWNQLQTRHSFSLYCAYVMGGFYKAGDLEAVCDSHDHVTAMPIGGEGHPPELRALMAEIAERVRIEQALRGSLQELAFARDDLAGSRSRLKTVADALPALVAYVDDAGRYQFVNRSYQRWFGADPQAMIGRHIAEVLGDAAFESVRPHVAAALAGDPVSFTASIPYQDGVERFVEASYIPDRGPDGRVLGYTALVTDISDRKRLEDSHARAADQTSRLLAITAAIADAVTEEEVHVAVVDQVAAALGASSAGLFLLDDRRRARLTRSLGYAEAARSKLDGLPVDGPFRVPALDTIQTGRAIFIDSQAELLASYPNLTSQVSASRSYRIASLPILAQSRPLGALAFTFDGTAPMDPEQRSFLLLVARYTGQALERLLLLDAERRSRARAEVLYRLARSIIEARGVADVFAAALDTIALTLGTERAAILVLDSAGVMRFTAHRGLSDEYRRAVEGHSPWPREVTDPPPVLVPDVHTDQDLAGFGPLFRAEGIGALGFFPLVAGGRLLGKFMVYHGAAREFPDHEIELALAIANHVGAAIARFSALAELERTVRFNEMFTGILGHDLRNPLHAIMTAASVAVLRADGERVVKPITRIMKSGERMARMIDQLLDFTRVRAGAGIPIEPRPLDLVPLVRQVADELEDGNPEWAFRIEHSGDTIGDWDGDRLGQVFSNLLGNAVQHGSVAGGVSVTIDGSEPATVTVSVRNDGAIPAHLVPRVFEPMSGGDTRRARSNSLGLGLFITEQIARAHGGGVSVASSEELGTTFTVTLPRGAAGEA
jgi:PAS domain S-box-containing protein